MCACGFWRMIIYVIEYAFVAYFQIGHIFGLSSAIVLPKYNMSPRYLNHLFTRDLTAAFPSCNMHSTSCRWRIASKIEYELFNEMEKCRPTHMTTQPNQTSNEMIFIAPIDCDTTFRVRSHCLIFFSSGVACLCWRMAYSVQHSHRTTQQRT